MLADTGNVPVNDAAKYAGGTKGVVADVLNVFTTVSEDGEILPYLDYATPTFDQTLGDALQQLMAGTMTPEAFVDALEADYAGFAK